MAPKYKNDLAKSYGLLKLDLNWKGTCEDVVQFSNALSLITIELASDETALHPIKKIQDMNEEDVLYASVAEFLNSYGCPYPVLENKHTHDRFSIFENRMLLLRYLCTELIAKRRISSRPQAPRADAHISQVTDQASAELSSDLSAYLAIACEALQLPKPNAKVDISQLFTNLTNASAAAIKRCPPSHMGKPMLPLVGVSDRQWSQIARIAALLQQEYASRRATLLKRLDVTVQSFKWSDKAKTQLEAIAAVYNPLRSAMAVAYFPGIAELLAVRDNMILRIEKTSGVTARKYTSCDLNKILIGKVPDRGGRAWELEPPPPEMPSFKQRQPDRGRGGGGGFGRSDFGRGGGVGGYGGRGGGPARGRGGGENLGSTRGFDGGGGAYYANNQPFRPPSSAQLAAGDYHTGHVVMDGLTQQMYGLVFEPGLGIGQPQGYTFQATNIPGTVNYGGARPPQRGRGGRGRGR